MDLEAPCNLIAQAPAALTAREGKLLLCSITKDRGKESPEVGLVENSLPVLALGTRKMDRKWRRFSAAATTTHSLLESESGEEKN